MLKVLVSTFWPEYLLLGVLLFIMDVVVRLVQPLMLGGLLDYFRSGTSVTKEDALWYAGAIVALNAVSALMINQYIMGAFHYGMRVRAACCSLIYRKVRPNASSRPIFFIPNIFRRFVSAKLLWEKRLRGKW